MKRINIIYGGVQYSVGHESLDAVKGKIEDALSSGRPQWLFVNQGEGGFRPAQLLITPGVDLALVPISEPSDEG